MGSNNQVEKELTEAGNKLLNNPTLSSTDDIITILLLTKNNLSKVPQSPPKSLIKPLHQMMNALIAKELMRHPDLNVNISVACCICEILRITAPEAPYNNEQIKDFFELVVISFDKLSSVSGGYYGKMTKLLEVFSKARLPILMLDLQQDGHGLFVRLFKHFLNVSDFDPTAIVLNMENIMRMVVEESEKLAIELQDLLLTSIGKDNQSGSPVCWQFGQKILMICAAKLKPIDRRSIAVFDYPEMVALICKKTTSDMTFRHCRGTSMASKSLTEINGKRKRNNEQLTKNNLSTVPQSPPKSLIKPLHQMMNALIAKELMRHPDLNVNISVACCICEILRITAPEAPYNNEQIKDFFELVVISFDKLSSVSGGYYGKMTKLLEVFSKARLPILMLDLQQDGHGLFVRLFKHFLNVSDFDPTAIVLNMENIMRMVVEESEKLAIELQDLLLTSIGKDNQSGSPVCWQFGQKILMICAAKLKPIDRRSIAVFDYPEMVAIICKKTTSDMTFRHCRGTSMASKSLTEINGKRKRNNEQAQSDEHGEILVGRKIKVWRAKDEIYRPGVVKSFDFILKMHKVLFDDGFEVVIDLKMKRWMFEKLSAIPDSSNERLEDENLEKSKEKEDSIVSSDEALFSNVREVELVPAGPAPRGVSSPQSSIICAQGYKVKSINAQILDDILKKHGDIASTCVFTDAGIRTSLLEGVCDIVRRIETDDVTNIISSIREIESQVYATEAAKINVSWLRASLNVIHKRNEAGKKVSTLIELKLNTTLVKRAAGTDLKERHANLVAAQNQFAEAKRCVEVLDLVEKKVNNNVLESKAEKDLWAGHPII